MMLSSPPPAAFRRDPATVLAAALMLAAPSLALLDALAIAPLLAVFGAGLLAAGGWRRLPGIARGAVAPLQLLLLALFIGWMGVASLWSPGPAFAIKSIGMMLGTMVGGLVVTAELRRFDAARLALVLRALAVGLAIGLLLLLTVSVAQRWLVDPEGPLGLKALRLSYAMDRGTTFVALLLWPAVAGLWRQGHRSATAMLVALAAPALGLSHDLAAKVTLVAGLGAFLVSLVAPRALAALLGVAIVVAVLGAPLAAQHLPAPERSIAWTWLPRSAHHRLTIWQFAGQTIAAKPWLGWGMEASRSMGGGAHLQLVDPEGRPVDEELMPLHPHDAPLQVWLELGALGAALLAAFIVTIARRLAQATAAAPPARAGAAAVIASGFLVSAVSYGFWQSWWQSAMWLAAALSVALLGGGADGRDAG